MKGFERVSFPGLFADRIQIHLFKTFGSGSALVSRRRKILETNFAFDTFEWSLFFYCLYH